MNYDLIIQLTQLEVVAGAVASADGCRPSQVLRRVKLGPQRHPTHSCRSCRPWLLVGQSACRTCCQLQVAGSLDTVPAAAVVASRDEVPGDARTHLVEGPWAAAVAAEDHRRFHRSESTSRCRGTCLVHCRPFNKLEQS